MKNKKSTLLILLTLAIAFGCGTPAKENEAAAHDQDLYEAKVIKKAIIIDGIANEDIWQQVSWYPIDQLWAGVAPDKEDLSGKFKLAWDKDYLYVLAQIEDDTLIDTHENKLEKYWDDDCLEIFIDENASGGNHQYNYNAFAYHIALDYSVADIGSDQNPILLNDHVDVKKISEGNTHTWEVAIKIYDDTFSPDQENLPVKLAQDKVMGFAIAYCDNDSSAERESFLGSEFIAGPDKNRGWIDAGVFGKVQLRK